MRLVVNRILIALLAHLVSNVTDCRSAAASTQSTIASQQPFARPPQVADSIRMTRIAEQYALMNFAKFSPDGLHFVVRVRKGNLEHNTNEYSLLLWDTDQAPHSAPPQMLVSFSSSTNSPAIHDVRWIDNNTITFIGVNGSETHYQLYAVNIRDHKARRLTNHPANVLSSGMTTDGRWVAYVAEAGKPPVSYFNEKTRREGVVVSNQSLFSLIADQKGYRRVVNADDQLFIARGGDKPRLLKVPGLFSDDLNEDWCRPLWSPDGRYIAIKAQVHDIPANWKEYTDKRIHRYAEVPTGYQYSYLEQWLLVDTASGESRTLLLNAPSAASSDLAWSPDSQSVVIGGIFLPLDGTTGNERSARQSQVCTAEINLRTGQVTIIRYDNLAIVEWSVKTGALVLKHRTRYDERDSGERFLFRKLGAQWEQLSEAPGPTHPEIVLDEDMNTPPRIVAIAPRTGKRSVLLDLNPQFRRIKFGKVEEFAWTGSDGRDIKGNLYYPVDYVAGERYPLVIQTHGWSPTMFWIDGPVTSAFAAQSLAGKGILVLQMDMSEAAQDTPREYETELAAYDGAIDTLDRMGSVDPTRVGITGFSRACLHVKYALTHSKHHFAAAAIMDGVDGGYFQYIVASNISPAYARISEVWNGGPPFGKGLEAWRTRSPGFNIDKVNTPVRIFAPSAGSVQMEWEWFAALHQMGRPVELVMMKDGEHELEKPWERMVSQQGNVDWFCFWLQGEEDPDPTKAEQYARWRELRKLQEMNATTKPN